VLPELTPQEDLPSANSLFSLSVELSGIAGPALGALLIATIGTPFAFILDGLTFLVSTICLIPLLKFDRRLAKQEEEGESEPSKDILADLREGLKTVVETPWLWVTILVAGLSNITYAGAMDVGLPFLIDEHLEAGVGVLGSFYSITSVGAVVGAIWLGRFDRFHRRGLRLFGWWAPIGICVMLLGFPIGVAGTLSVAFILGVLNAHLGLVWTNILQECVPRDLLGRVSSVDYFGSYLFNPVGLFVGGLAIASFGPAPVFIVGGIITAILIAMGLLHPAVRALN
jgi:DHA3 family tetracycline resistance protein-like MFS transporter